MLTVLKDWYDVGVSARDEKNRADIVFHSMEWVQLLENRLKASAIYFTFYEVNGVRASLRVSVYCRRTEETIYQAMQGICGSPYEYAVNVERIGMLGNHQFKLAHAYQIVKYSHGGLTEIFAQMMDMAGYTPEKRAAAYSEWVARYLLDKAQVKQ